MNKFEANVGDYITPKESINYITVGKYYIVERIDNDGDVWVRDDDGVLANRYAADFDLVNPTHVEYNGNTYKVEGKVSIDSDLFAERVNRDWNIKSFYDDGYNDFFILKGGNTLMIPAKLCKPTTVSKTIKLTDSYDAVIEKDVIKVGCQNIPISKVEEILAEHKALFKH